MAVPFLKTRLSDWDCAIVPPTPHPPPRTQNWESAVGQCVTPACVLIVTPSVLCLFCSRAHSPALGAHSFSGVQRFNLSSHSQSPRRHSVSQSPNSNSNSSYLTPETEPIVPELCIDHLWTEAITSTRFGVDVFIFKEKCC